ncbi:hypothetical protein [Longimicrobium terrae]|uniref:Uncharacterized protein n=1 Tax=Longimicrobium terrae TaxID=1639882 RepID=A0A841GZI5_9BACT|nr:hypothetical protein [Longimicrobium terrae]MBB4636912.1 hypothetical protein [Longimicrobium terrae]MBB6071089.1 hypothetical protein [Longimicrobium terrae]NNC29140.1 hypothetical protein [Longimicrobium terrae]
MPRAPKNAEPKASPEEALKLAEEAYEKLDAAMRASHDLDTTERNAFRERLYPLRMRMRDELHSLRGEITSAGARRSQPRGTGIRGSEG